MFYEGLAMARHRTLIARAAQADTDGSEAEQQNQAPFNHQGVCNANLSIPRALE